MSDKPNDGGPAFPQSVSGHDGPTASYDFVDGAGMSLRDYFAAKALSAVTAGDHIDGAGDMERHTAMAYAYADAMLKAREAKREHA